MSDVTIPENIPADVWKAADEALDNMLCNCIEASGTTEQLRIDSTVPLARAILAERERSAQAAKKAALELRGWPVSEEQAEVIAQAIRSSHD